MIQALLTQQSVQWDLYLDFNLTTDIGYPFKLLVNQALKTKTKTKNGKMKLILALH